MQVLYIITLSNRKAEMGPRWNDHLFPYIKQILKDRYLGTKLDLQDWFLELYEDDATNAAKPEIFSKIICN